jgi:hypothetical protein
MNDYAFAIDIISRYRNDFAEPRMDCPPNRAVVNALNLIIKDLTGRQREDREATSVVAVRYGFDGHGYSYADNSFGSDWLTRFPDAEPLCVAHLAEDGGRWEFVPAGWAVSPIPEWRPMSTAPRNGSHILARDAACPSRPPATVHWFDGGWHLSVNRYSNDSDHGCSTLTDWHPLPETCPTYAPREGGEETRS